MISKNIVVKIIFKTNTFEINNRFELSILYGYYKDVRKLSSV